VIAFASVWIALATLVTALVMLAYRPMFTDLTVFFVLWLGSPGSLCLAGLVLWSHRREELPSAEIRAQRLQCKVAISLSIAAAAIVYYLVIRADQVPSELLGA